MFLLKLAFKKTFLINLVVAAVCRTYIPSYMYFQKMKSRKKIVQVRNCDFRIVTRPNSGSGNETNATCVYVRKGKQKEDT